MQKRNFKRLAQSVNERMEIRYQIDKAMMAKDKFESFYYNDIEEGKLRSITPEMLDFRQKSDRRIYKKNSLPYKFFQK